MAALTTTPTTSTTDYFPSVRVGLGMVILGWIGLFVWNVLPGLGAAFNLEGAAAWILTISLIGIVGGILTLVGNGFALATPRSVATPNKNAKNAVQQALIFSIVGIVAFALAAVSAAVGGAALVEDPAVATTAERFASAPGAIYNVDLALTRMAEATEATAVVSGIATLGLSLLGVIFCIAGIFKFQRYCVTLVAHYNHPSAADIDRSMRGMRTCVGLFVAVALVTALLAPVVGYATIREAFTLETSAAIGIVMGVIGMVVLVAAFVFQFMVLGRTMSAVAEIKRGETTRRDVVVAQPARPEARIGPIPPGRRDVAPSPPPREVQPTAGAGAGADVRPGGDRYPSAARDDTPATPLPPGRRDAPQKKSPSASESQVS